MKVYVSVQVDGREISRFEQQICGDAVRREEQAVSLGRQLSRVVTEASLNELADASPRPQCCGRPMRHRGHRRLAIQGLSGLLRIDRVRYRCGCCGREAYPADEHLECGRHRVTQPLAKRVCQLAVVEHFTQLERLIHDQHAVRLGHDLLVALVHAAGGEAQRRRCQQAQQWQAQAMEEQDWPQAEVHPRRVYVSCDGIIYCTNQREPHPTGEGRRLIWQEMKVGCVYWQDQQDQWHKQITWGREGPEQFGRSLFLLACRCGYLQAEEKIFAADGSPWCWNIKDLYFSSAVGILDWFHLSEHIWDTGRTLWGEQAAHEWVECALDLLQKRGGRALIPWLKTFRAGTRRWKRDRLDRLIRYLQQRSDHTNYPCYRRRGWQIGTGMIESTVKQLVGIRLKGPGMHWTEAGALAITALRAHHLNHRWHQFWDTRPLAA